MASLAKARCECAQHGRIFSNLSGFLLNVFLVDANSVDPEVSRLRRMPQRFQSSSITARYWSCLSIAKQDIQRLRSAPGVGLRCIADDVAITLHRHSIQSV
jgi:hypothetical protein